MHSAHCAYPGKRGRKSPGKASNLGQFLIELELFKNANYFFFFFGHQESDSNHHGSNTVPGQGSDLCPDAAETPPIPLCHSGNAHELFKITFYCYKKSSEERLWF